MYLQESTRVIRVWVIKSFMETRISMKTVFNHAYFFLFQLTYPIKLCMSTNALTAIMVNLLFNSTSKCKLINCKCIPKDRRNSDFCGTVSLQIYELWDWKGKLGKINVSAPENKLGNIEP